MTDANSHKGKKCSLILLTAIICTILWLNTNDPIHISNSNIQELIGHHKTNLQMINNSNLANIKHIWFDIFRSTFISNEIQFKFNSNLNITNDFIHTLIILTADTLSNYARNNTLLIINQDNHLFRDLISIRRYIMLLNIYYINNNFQYINSQTYNQILQYISNIELKYNQLFRNQYIIINLHPSRSAGTTICTLFKRAKNEEIRIFHSKDNIHMRITMHPDWKKNCNYPSYNEQFLKTYKDKAYKHSPTTCKQQYSNLYEIKKNKNVPKTYSFLARESPLFPKDNNANYGQLCDRFIYMFAFRSPFERIISWLNADTMIRIVQKTNITNYNKINVPLDKKIADEILYKDFFYGLFNNKLENIRWNSFIVDVDGIKQFHFYGRWLKGYSNNLITRWIGYEWPYKSVLNGDRDGLFNGLIMDPNELNKNIKYYMYNAIERMLQMDYVLNFAAYSNNITHMNDSYELKNSYQRSIFNKNDNESMWNEFFKQMNKHFYPKKK
eukprot:538237_1